MDRHIVFSLLYIQALQNHGQAHIALFKIGHGGQNLLIGGTVAGFPIIIEGSEGFEANNNVLTKTL